MKKKPRPKPTYVHIPTKEKGYSVDVAVRGQEPYSYWKMTMVDEETRQILLRKTWCHGQAILPAYSALLLAWWWHMEARPFRLVLASVVLPTWALYSYQ